MAKVSSAWCVSGTAGTGLLGWSEWVTGDEQEGRADFAGPDDHRENFVCNTNTNPSFTELHCQLYFSIL